MNYISIELLRHKARSYVSGLEKNGDDLEPSLKRMGERELYSLGWLLSQTAPNFQWRSTINGVFFLSHSCLLLVR